MHIARVVALGSVIFAAVVQGQDSTLPPFLKPRQDYVIQFAGRSPFQHAESRRTSPDREYVQVFTLVALAGGSWVLVEHPRRPEDAAAWNSKRLAMAALTPQSIAALTSTDDGQVRLKKLREAAAQEIDTSRTWINMDHAVAVRMASADPNGYDPVSSTNSSN